MRQNLCFWAIYLCGNYAKRCEIPSVSAFALNLDIHAIDLHVTVGADENVFDAIDDTRF